MKLMPNSKKGQILIEIIIAVALLGILFHAVFTLLNGAFQTVGEVRVRQTAKHLAQSKIEEIHNLPYDQIGTINGIPSGSIAQYENKKMNGISYNIFTTVIYVDDPFDQFAPNDTLPTDYKRIRVEVNWKGLFPSKRPITLITDIAPQGMEEAEDGGTILIQVADANVNPIPNAEVQLVNDSVNPEINLNLKTNDQGKLLIPGAPACATCYFVSVTKNGYTTSRTYSNQEIANPTKAYLTVEEGGLTDPTFFIDKTSTITIKSYGSRLNGFPPLGNITFHLQGTKKIGTDTSENPVYKIGQDYTTNTNGEIILEDFEWDNYTFTLTDDSLDLAGNNPFELNLLPDSNLVFHFATKEHENNSLLIQIMNNADEPIGSASAELSREEFNEATTSGKIDQPNFGQVFFSPLDSGEHELFIKADGYEDTQNTIDVSGQSIEKIILQEQ